MDKKMSDKFSKLQLDDLISQDKSTLDQWFLAGETPTIGEINGITNGRVLSGITVLESDVVRTLVNRSWLPWQGKTFFPINDEAGKGVNRLKVGPVKRDKFEFTTTIIPALVGDKPVFSLNYDHPHNPWYIRPIRDDLKKLKDGLFLGTANVRLREEYHFVLYFALELASLAGINKTSSAD
ncbi:MAG: hypothetical protein HQM11_02830 [SAR324 cluster bacterium]|nr:hypothetical protein [SAR324 cluster bacterium]